MLIIFDLDDTLIETSKCLTPHYLHKCFVSMQSAGLNDEENKLETLIALNKKAISLREALKEFCMHNSVSKELYEEGLQTLQMPFPDNLNIEIVPGALDLLDHLQKSHALALVTAGSPIIQRQKLKKAGIQPERFSKLIIGEGFKKLDYQTVLSELNFAPEETVVCGDRVPMDLTPAKELGILTVHFRNGRGLVHGKPEADVDVVLDELPKLHEVIEKYESKSSSYK